MWEAGGDEPAWGLWWTWRILEDEPHVGAAPEHREAQGELLWLLELR